MASEGVLATLQAGWQAIGTCGLERAVIGGFHSPPGTMPAIREMPTF